MKYFSNAEKNIDRHPRELSEDDMCDWRQVKKAIDTDGVYAYCSIECRKAFLKNAIEALLDDRWEKLLKE